MSITAKALVFQVAVLVGSGMHGFSKANEACWLKQLQLIHFWSHILLHGCSPLWCDTTLCPHLFTHVGSRDRAFLPGRALSPAPIPRGELYLSGIAEISCPVLITLHGTQGCTGLFLPSATLS